MSIIKYNNVRNVKIVSLDHHVTSKTISNCNLNKSANFQLNDPCNTFVFIIIWLVMQLNIWILRFCFIFSSANAYLCDSCVSCFLFIQTYYYLAIVEDLILRFTWTLTASIEEESYMNSEILKSILASLEVFR